MGSVSNLLTRRLDVEAWASAVETAGCSAGDVMVGFLSEVDGNQFGARR